MKPGHSTLCYGVQWDAIMRWISKDNTLTGVLTNSSSIGNYTGTLRPTGDDPKNQIKNIYDMAGNVYEWTMEAYDTVSRVIRGGGCISSGDNFPASYRYYLSPDYSNDDIGFRVTLYL